MKIILTGATGFIGQYVYNKLLKIEHEVFILSRNPSSATNWQQIDIFNKVALDEFIATTKADCLIHLAWDVTHGVFWTAPNNQQYAEASKFLFKSFIKHGGKKIISAGTCAEYPTSNLPVSEDLEFSDTLTPYGQAKREVFNCLKELQQEHGINYTWFRIFGIYGPRENPARFIPAAINAIANQVDYPLKNPNIFADYVYVDDLANFVINAITKEINGPVNIGTGKALALQDLYITLKNFAGTGQLQESNTITTPDINSRIPDCSKLWNNSFRFNFESGFNKMFAEYQNR